MGSRIRRRLRAPRRWILKRVVSAAAYLRVIAGGDQFGMVFSGSFLRLLDSDLFLADVFSQGQREVVSQGDCTHIFSFQLQHMGGQNSSLEVTLAQLAVLVGPPHV